MRDTALKENGRSAHRMLVLSPHFDDAVLSCGALLAYHPDSMVLTVYAGVPDADMPAPDWDRRCGFSSARQAMRVRGQENHRALAILRAHDLRLDLLDSQYGGIGAGMHAGLQAALQRHLPDIVLFPLGLFHEDHIRLSDTVLRLRRQHSHACLWVAYEDVPYCWHPGRVQHRLGTLEELGICATRWRTVWAGRSGKVQAVAAYASQLHALGMDAATDLGTGHEHYWALSDQDEGHA